MRKFIQTLFASLGFNKVEVPKQEEVTVPKRKTPLFIENATRRQKIKRNAKRSLLKQPKGKKAKI